MTLLLKNITGLITRISDWVQRISLILCGIVLIAMVVIAGLGVFYRFILHNSLSWNEELDAYLFVWLTCLGGAIGFKFGAHPAVTFLVDRIPNNVRKLVIALSDAIVAVLGVVMLIYGGEMVTLIGTETASSINMSMTYPYLAIPVGGVALIVHAIEHILNILIPNEQSDTYEISGQTNGKERTLWEH
jgi:TRAP-type C4-dicarboxylate transport system permease small subunit